MNEYPEFLKLIRTPTPPNMSGIEDGAKWWDEERMLRLSRQKENDAAAEAAWVRNKESITVDVRGKKEENDRREKVDEYFQGVKERIRDKRQKLPSMWISRERTAREEFDARKMARAKRVSKLEARLGEIRKEICDAKKLCEEIDRIMSTN